MRHTNKTIRLKTINTSSKVLRAQAGALSMDLTIPWLVVQLDYSWRNFLMPLYVDSSIAV